MHSFFSHSRKLNRSDNTIVLQYFLSLNSKDGTLDARFPEIVEGCAERDEGASNRLNGECRSCRAAFRDFRLPDFAQADPLRTGGAQVNP